jgi:hypothetical protein
MKTTLSALFNLPPRRGGLGWGWLGGGLLLLALAFVSCEKGEKGEEAEVKPELTVSPASFDAAAAGESLSVRVTSNAAWNAVSSAAWCSPSPASATAGRQVSVSVAANPATDARAATVTFTAGTLTRTVTVNQATAGGITVSRPTGVSVNQESGGAGARISWTASTTSGGTVDYYEVERSSSSSFTLLGSSALTSYTDASPLQGNNYYRIRAVVNLPGTATAVYSNYSAVASYNNTNFSGGTESGLYLGIIGFNESLNVKPVDLLTGNTKSQYAAFVNNMESRNGTVLYYAVDNAVTRLQAATLPADLINVSIVTFTDGLDQGSTGLNPDYPDRATYLNAVHERIESVKIKDKDIAAYSIGIKGNDVSDDAAFTNNLIKLASSADNATQVTSMAEVNSRFQEIASSLYDETQLLTVKLKIPVQDPGARIRFTFDPDRTTDNVGNSALYIEGTYASPNTLQNVVYHGMASNSSNSATVAGTPSGIFVTFSFEKLVKDGGGTLATNHVKQWEYIASSGRWQVNSEFTPDNNTETIVDRQSAVIMLVLDCSSSLGTQFADVKTAANNFINILTSSQSGGQQPSAYVTVGSLAVQLTDITTDASWSSANSLCSNSTAGGLTGWRLPTQSELTTLYNNRTAIGGFTTGWYWASTSCSSGHVQKSFSNGDTGCYSDSERARCVHTL